MADNIFIPFSIIITLLILLTHSYFVIKSIIYHRSLKKQKTNSSWIPKARVFIPCKGFHQNLEKNLLSIATQDYPYYKVIFSTESEQDPAVAIIKKITSIHSNCVHVSAGSADSCGQKNHNLLKALEKDTESDVLVFADDDIRPGKNWLKNLIEPLQENSTVATGYRWLDVKWHSFAGSLHAILNAFTVAFMCDRIFGCLWGGSMAIRREDFYKLKIDELWAHTVVDDTSLTQAIRKNKFKLVYVPECLICCPGDNLPLKSVLDWFTRQIMYGKFYFRRIWYGGFVLQIFTIASVFSIFYLWHNALTVSAFLLPAFAVSALMFMIFLSCSLLKFQHKASNSWILWFFMVPFAQLGATYCLFRTLFMQSLTWKNTKYLISNKGLVLKIER
jgi:cellulose synthase/poly-beta-1,6-N-acetylglucosamine synthase-like glycosyltransferase